MFGTSLHPNYCKQTVALKTVETMQYCFDHCELLRPMNKCKNYCNRRQLLQRHPPAEPTPSSNSKTRERKRRVNINLFAGDLPVGGESPGRVSRGQRFMCYLRNPRNIPLFVQVRARKTGTWGDWTEFYVTKVGSTPKGSNGFTAF